MTHMITRCPACGTCFRITEAQLNTAKGAVRCGSCLQIFRALENQVNDPKAEQSTPAPSRQAPSTPERAPERAQSAAGSPRPAASQAGLFTAIGKNTAASAPTASASPASTQQPPSAPRDTVNADFSMDLQAMELEEDDDDILISDEMPLEDDGEEKRPSFDDGFSDNFLELSGWKPSPKSLFEREAKAPAEDDDENKEDLDESWAISLLEDEHEDTPKSVSADKASAKPAELPKPTPPSAPAPAGLAPDDDLGLSAVADDKWDQAAEPTFGSAIDEFDELFDGQGEKLVRERRNLLSCIQPEPVEFSSYQGRNWRKLLLWGGLSLVGLLVLIAQIAWFQFDALSRHQPYRSLYTAICPLLNCQVPSLAAPDLIRTSNLVVRSHPDAEGALVVDTILLNTASFQQPFPALTLTFSNRHGETVASRRFQPTEYLAGELAGRRLMPSNQPIHLTLEIVDPGPEAVSYSAYIPH